MRVNAKSGQIHVPPPWPYKESLHMFMHQPKLEPLALIMQYQLRQTPLATAKSYENQVSRTKFFLSHYLINICFKDMLSY